MHLLVLAEGPSQKQREFVEWASSLQYDFEGEKRQGYNRPLVSEVKLYDIRIKKECVPEFMRDLSPITEHDFMKGWVSKLFGIVRRVVGMKKLGRLAGKPLKPMSPWFYTYVFGAVEDWHNAPGEEAL